VRTFKFSVPIPASSKWAAATSGGLEEVGMGRYTNGFITILLGVIVVRNCQAQTASGSVTHPASRLRPASTFVAGVIEEGICRSATLRSMVATLQTTDLIVYVTMVPLTDRRVDAGLQYVGAMATDRVLRIVLRFPLDRIARMVMLAHELQHAVEVASAPEIRSQKALEDHYRAHGVPGAKESTYETDTARRTELRVRDEVTARFTKCGDVQHARN
jgi:hypothetical protein